MEEWKVISEDPFVEVSNLGFVRWTYKPKPSGVYAELKINKVHKSFHVWVAKAFLGPCPEGMVVDHIDGDRENNCSANLQYITPRGNNRKGLRTKLTMEQVKEIRRRHSLGETMISLGRAFGVHYVTISYAVRYKTWRIE